MRIRKLRIFVVFFVVLVLIAVYGLALLRTYVFKPPPSSSATPTAVAWIATTNSPAGIINSTDNCRIGLPSDKEEVDLTQPIVRAWGPPARA